MVMRCYLLIWFAMGWVIGDLPSVVGQESRRSQAVVVDLNQRGQEKVKINDRPQELVDFVNNARSLPPEFAADLMIRLVQLNQVKDSAFKREVLEEAFRLGANAQQPVKRIYVSSYPIDTRSGYLGQSFDGALDALSLQTRAIGAMLLVDKRKARELMSEITQPELKPLGCDDSLVYDVTDLYKTGGLILRSAYSTEEIDQGEDVRLIQGYLGGLISPCQVGPAIEMIVDQGLPASKLETVLDTLARSLTRITGDDRSFWGSRRSMSDALNRLLKEARIKAIAPDTLLQGYRSYLVNHLSGHRCADTYQEYANAQSEMIRDFNQRLRLVSLKNTPAIDGEEIKPSKIDGREKAELYWQSPKSLQVLAKIKDLKFGGGKTTISDNEMGSLEWQNKLDRFLNDLEAWEVKDEKSAEDYFNQKSILLKGLLEFLKPSPVRDKVMQTYVGMLDDFDLQRGSRIEWFRMAKYLIGVAGNSQSFAARPKWLDAVGAPKNTVLSMYLNLQKLVREPATNNQ